jgi:hypothetical protein
MEEKIRVPVYYAYVMDKRYCYPLESKLDKIQHYAIVRDIKYSKIMIEKFETNYGEKLSKFIDTLFEGDGIILYNVRDISNCSKIFFDIIDKTWERKIKLVTIRDGIDSFTSEGEALHRLFYSMRDFFLKPSFIMPERMAILKEFCSPEEFELIDEHVQYSSKEDYMISIDKRDKFSKSL